MRIPNADRAVIDPRKLHGYLLSPSHQVGRFKATFFRTLGYAPDDWGRLEADLRSQHLTKEATVGERTSHGQKYVIRATLVGPLGRSVDVLTVWFIRRDEEVPRFVTAYPEGGE